MSLIYLLTSLASDMHVEVLTASILVSGVSGKLVVGWGFPSSHGITLVRLVG